MTTFKNTIQAFIITALLLSIAVNTSDAAQGFIGSVSSLGYSGRYIQGQTTLFERVTLDIRSAGYKDRFRDDFSVTRIRSGITAHDVTAGYLMDRIDQAGASDYENGAFIRWTPTLRDGTNLILGTDYETSSGRTSSLVRVDLGAEISSKEIPIAVRTVVSITAWAKNTGFISPKPERFIYDVGVGFSF